MKHFESLESTQPRLQGGRPSPETPRGSQSDCGSSRELMTLRES